MPALATTRSRPPASARNRSTAPETAARSPTSAGSATALGPSSAASASSSDTDRDSRPTAAPRAASARAISRPMPREAPVTSARVVASMRMGAEDMLTAMSHDQATVAEEEYLQTIFWLQEAGLPMTGANVARAMQLSAPTVHEMIGRLERDGYITRGPDKALVFTDNGREHAEGVVRRHRLIERFLTDVLGIPWDEVHEEAERLEHAMSPVLEERMRSAIGDAKTCPHGHPINVGERMEGVPLADAERGASVRILRFENEAEDLLHYLKDAGIEPGMEGTVAERDDDHVVVESDGRRCELTRSVAETVTVQADPSPPARTALPEQLVLSKDRYGR